MVQEGTLDERIAALQALAGHPPAAEGAVPLARDVLLAEPSEPEAFWCLRVLVQAGYAAGPATDAARPFVDAESDLVASCATWALAEAGTSSEHLKSRAAALTQSESAIAREFALWALARLGDASVLQSVMDLAAQGPPARQVYALRALEQLGPSATDAWPLLLDLLSEPEALPGTTLHHAARALVRVAPHDASADVRPLLSSGSAEVRTAAAATLARLGASDREVLQALEAGLASSLPDVQVSALQGALYLDAIPQDWRIAIEGLVSAPPHVSIMARFALLAMGDEEMTRWAFERLDSFDARWQVRLGLALATRGDDRGVERLKRLSQHADWVVSSEAELALAAATR
jgi:HEAT repeat protein